MKKLYFYIAIACIAGLSSCSSVRNNTYAPLPKREAVPANSKGTESAAKPQNPGTGKSKTKTTTGKTSEQKPVPQKTENINRRFSDTTSVVVSAKAETIHYGLSSQFDMAVTKFENAQTQNDKKGSDSACMQINSFTETLEPVDSLRYEAMFMRSECLIAKEEISEAQKVLSSLMNDKNLPTTILEKVLVRLGQVYCVMNKKQNAEEMFTRLKKQFPGSIYEPLANCESVAPR